MTSEEKNDTKNNYVCPPLKPYKPTRTSTTKVFTDLLPEEVFKILISDLDEKNSTYTCTPKRWRLNYCKKKTYATSLDEEDL